MIRRARGLAAVVALATAVAAAPAAAYWNTGGGGIAQAPVDTLAGGIQPSVSAAGQAVTVAWAQTSFRASPLGGLPGGSYALRRYPAAGGSAVVPGTGCATATGAQPTLSCVEQAVPPGQWRYSVTPVLNTWTGAESARSASVAIAPGAPALTSATSLDPAPAETTGDIVLVWEAVSGATGYDVHRRTAGGAYDFSAPLNGLAPVQGTGFTDPGTGLTGGTTYTYTVRAITDGIRSADSVERSAVAVARPATPGGVSATSAPGGRITVAWTAVAGVGGYDVYRRTPAGAYDFAQPLNGATRVTGTSYSDATAADGTTYHYVVKAAGTGAGGSTLHSFASAESAVALSDATAPGGVSLADPGTLLKGAVALSATASDAGTGVASVRFQYSPAGGAAWSDGCVATAAPYACSLATTAIADGLYDLRALATDAAGNLTGSAVLGGRRIDNTAPAATMGDPGAFIRGTVNLTATAADAGSGLASIRIQRAPTGSATWTDVCTVTASPASCALNTAALAEGGYDLRAVATDAAGHPTTSAPVVNRVVDNTAPVGVDVQTTNRAGGIAARPEAGDVLTLTFSEPVRPASVLAGWTGAATPVVVRFTNGNPDVITVYDAQNTVQAALGSVTSGKKYVTASTTFSTSSMVLAGNSVAVTFGGPSGPTATATGAGTLQWITSTAATDRAGNPLGAATVLETGGADLDF